MQDDNQLKLQAAIRSADLERAYQLIDSGIDLNKVGEAGNTALHEASLNGYAHLAALLLSMGADYTVRNSDKQTALSSDFVDIRIIHRIRQEYQRMPMYPYDQKSENPQVNGYVEQLNRDGLVKVSGVINTEQLSQLQKDFKSFIKHMRIKRFLKFKRNNHYDNKEYWQAQHHAYVTNDALLYSDELVKICANPMLTEIASHYLEESAFAKRVYAMRYLPFRSLNINQFRWHHDMEDRQLKVLLLLTDVDEKGQHMSYVKGTHKAFHPYKRFFTNDLDFEYYETDENEFETVKTIGKAGDLFLFDSNGMHRGVRSHGNTRDAYFIEYTAAKNPNNIWGSESSSDIALAAKKDKSNPLHKLFNTTPKWMRTKNKKRRNNPTWIESLENPQLWV